MDSPLKPYDSFSSFQELLDAIEQYEKVNRVRFWIRDAKKLHRASSSVHNIVKDYPELEYCMVRFSCIYGGKPWQQRKNVFVKRRKSQGSCKQDCKAEICIKLNGDKNRLIITKMEEEHNHDIPTEEDFKHFPQGRRITKKRKLEKSKKIFSYNFHTKVDESKGIRLDNIVKTNSLSRSKNFQRIATILEEKYSCMVDLQKDDVEKIYGFFFQDHQMKKLYELYPEILLIDGTVKLPNLRCFAYFFSIENSMGTSNVVAVAVLTVEDPESAEWALEKFKERNAKWINTSVVVTDRQTSECQLSTIFPNSTHLICVPHAIHTFTKDLNQFEPSTVTPEEAPKFLDIFKKMTEAESDEEYDQLLEELEDNSPDVLITCFYQKWHRLRHLWTKGSSVRTYVGSKIERPTSRFKCTIANCRSFSVFIEKLFQTLYLRRNELLNQFNKMTEANDDTKCYSKILTGYAFQKIKPLLLSTVENDCPFIFKIENEDVICETPEAYFIVSELSCDCDFFTTLKLPCAHILRYRKLQNMDLFDECLFSPRWTKSHMRALFKNDPPSVQERSCEEKFQEAAAVCVELATLCSEVPEGEFQDRMAALLELKKSWEGKQRVDVQMIGSEGEMDHEDSESIILEITS